MSTAAEVIARLRLAPHPEGGWYRETHRSDVVLPAAALPARYGGDRRAVTSILYLLEQSEVSRPHRVRSEELWLHHGGDDLELTRAAPEGGAGEVLRLGRSAGAVLQAVVPAGWIQSARPAAGPHGFSLVGCVVAPGFEFDDFELVAPEDGPAPARP